MNIKFTPIKEANPWDLEIGDLVLEQTGDNEWVKAIIIGIARTENRYTFQTVNEPNFRKSENKWEEISEKQGNINPVKRLLEDQSLLRKEKVGPRELFMEFISENS